MGKKYDKHDKDAFCERYQKYDDTGSDGATIKSKFESGAIEIFGSYDNFLSYFNKEYFEDSADLKQYAHQTNLETRGMEIDKSKLVKMIQSRHPQEIRKGNMKSILINLFKKLNEEGYFESVGYSPGNFSKMPENKLWNIYGRTRGNLLFDKEFNLEGL